MTGEDGAERWVLTCLFTFKIGRHVGQAGLELFMMPSEGDLELLILLALPGITGVCHHGQFGGCLG